MWKYTVCCAGCNNALVSGKDYFCDQLQFFCFAVIYDHHKRYYFKCKQEIVILDKGNELCWYVLDAYM